MRTIPPFLLLAGLAVFGAVVGGCALPDAWSEPQADGVPLPEGDIEDGRRAFLAHGCALCHGATGESAFPTPATTHAGPMIGGAQSEWSAYEMAEAIIDASCEVPPEFREPRVTDDGTPDSPMAEYADVLTLQELADLVAYMRYLSE